jgi:hypothetical protein
MAYQPSLAIPFPATSPLVTIETARAALAIDEDSVLALIDCGRLRWSWDISLLHGRIREVRIWNRCIAAYHAGDPQPGTSLEEVVREVVSIGARERLRAADARKLLICSQQHIQRLVRNGILRGEVIGRTRWVQRESLESFLLRRRIA